MFHLPTTDTLKLLHTKIHFFGLGFIQVKLDNVTRYHFYTDKLPSIMPEEEIHNHRYEFTSRVLKGALRQEIFQPVATEDGPYDLVTVICKPDEEDIPSIFKWQVYKIVDMVLPAGAKYTVPHTTYHRVRGLDGTVTALTRQEPVVDRAGVLRLRTDKKVCPFSKEVPEVQLWEIVDHILRS